MPPIRDKSLRFTHVHLENWRNFQQADVPLQSRMFLVGPNASGKSNFLDVFRFLRDIVSVGGGFQAAVGRQNGVSSLRCLAARRNSDVVVRIRLGSEDNAAAWEYELRFNQTAERGPVIKRERVARNGRDILIRPDDEDKKDTERLTQTYLQQVYANQAFREVAGLFASVRYLHIVPQLIREPDRSVGRSNDPYGGDFLEQVAKTPDKVQKARLKRILKALAVAVPQLKELELWRDNRGVPHLRGRYEHWRPHGAWQTEERFSDGTLRLMGLLWVALERGGTLLLEEPELSLHPEVVRFIPQIFARVQSRSGRQIVVSTHSPDMLRDSGIGLDEVLLFVPTGEGTEVRPAASIPQAAELLRSGLPLADVVLPEVRPASIEQLTFDFMG